MMTFTALQASLCSVLQHSRGVDEGLHWWHSGAAGVRQNLPHHWTGMEQAGVCVCKAISRFKLTNHNLVMF